MISYYYVNGKRVDAEQWLDASVASHNRPIIEKLERELEKRADAYYKMRPKEIDYKYLLDSHKREIDVYAETPEGKAFVENFLNEHPLKSVHGEAAKLFWFYSILIIGLIAILIYINSK